MLRKLNKNYNRLNYFYQLILIIVIQLHMCYSQENTNPSSLRFISPQLAQALLDSGKGVFIDVSSYQDYLESHAKGAKSFSISRIEEFPIKYPDTNQNYILIGKNVLEALNCLTKWGYKNIYIISRNDKFDNDYDTTEFWEKEGAPIERWNNIIVGGDTFYVSGLEISRMNKGIPIRVANFTQPTISMLEMYRNIIETHFDDRDDENIDLFKEINGVSYEINCITFFSNKIWVGFSFYEGEGYKGYGGIGFYDIQNSKVGVLRHPALINHSAREIKLTDSKILIQTIGNYEGMTGVGNGLVEIDFISMRAISKIPPGTETIWDKDGGETVAFHYDKPIEETSIDQGFKLKEVEQYKSEDSIVIASLGYERYMVEQAKYESELRQFSLLNSNMVLDTTFTLTPQENIKQFPYGDGTGILFHGETWLCDFCSVSFEIDREYIFFPTSGIGATVSYSNDKYSFNVKLVDYETKNDKTLFTSMKIQLVVKEVR